MIQPDEERAASPCWNPNVNMPTSRLSIRTWRRSAQGRSHHFPRAVRQQPPLQHEGLTGTVPAAVCRDCTEKARDVHCLSPSLRFPLTFHFTFPQSPWTLYPLCCCPSPSLLSPKQKKKTTHLISHISLIPTLLRPSLGDPYWLNTQLSLG